VRRFARQIAKKILACAFVGATRDADANLNTRARKVFIASRYRRKIVIAISPYFIAVFAISENCARP
jgi:hypothetical protein